MGMAWWVFNSSPLGCGKLFLEVVSWPHGSHFDQVRVTEGWRPLSAAARLCRRRVGGQTERGWEGREWADRYRPFVDVLGSRRWSGEGSACGRTEILTRSEGPSRLACELSEQPVCVLQISSSDRKFKCTHSQLHTQRTLKAKPTKSHFRDMKTVVD